MPNLRVILLLLVFVLVLIAIPVSFYIIRQVFILPQQIITPPESVEEAMIINSPQDLAMALLPSN